MTTAALTMSLVLTGAALPESAAETPDEGLAVPQSPRWNPAQARPEPDAARDLVGDDPVAAADYRRSACPALE